MSNDAPNATPAPGPRLADCIHGKLRGRARFRARVLYRAENLCEAVERDLRRKDPIHEITVNPLTGSLLVHYHPARADVDRIDALVQTALARALQLPITPHGDSPRERERDRGKVTSLMEYIRARGAQSSAPGGDPPSSLPWHSTPLDEVMRHLGLEGPDGLNAEEAARRLERDGHNSLMAYQRRAPLELFLSQFVSMPVLLLGISAGVAIATGGLLDAVVIGSVVLINAGIGFVTENYAEKTINALTQTTDGMATVIRDGRRLEVPTSEIVAGDLVLLSPGQRVPADARLLDGERLTVDESSLTGESMPIKKDGSEIADRDTPLADRMNMLHMGTYVTGGSGRGLIVSTGARTEIGRIQTMVGTTRPPETPMQQQLGGMGTQLAFLSAGVCGLVFVAGILRGHTLVEMLKTSISLAVAAVPEGLPAVATSTLALGMQGMRRRNVLIRRLDAVESLGSVQVICLDKTGTLTRNRMSVVEINTPERRVHLSDGEFFSAGEPIAPDTFEALVNLLKASALCNEAEVNQADGGEDEPRFNGSPTENALLEAAEIAGFDIPALREELPTRLMRYRSESRHYMASWHSTADDRHFLAVKGSPEQVLEHCTHYQLDGEAAPLDDDRRDAILHENERMAGDAMRVLGVACAETPLDESREVRDLTWLGLVGMSDPIRPGMVELIRRFHRSGIATVMITGDQSATAYAIGRQLELADHAPLQILDSNRLEKMDEKLLAGLVDHIHVFSRVSPAHKLKIVQAFQRAGKVVAMTGDGINDTPALRAADIGVAMGRGGTEAAHATADIILEDDNLHTMVEAVEQGRTIYADIRKAIHFLLSTNFSEIEVMFASILLGLGQPLNPMQLLWINLISDIFPGLALALEPPPPDILDRPPRSPDESIISGRDLANTGVESVTITASTLASYGYALARYGPGMAASTHAFSTLTLSQLLHTHSCRSETHSLFDRGNLPRNPYMNWALGGSLGIQLLAMALPPVRKLLGTTAISASDAAVIAATSGVPLLVNEFIKTLRNRSAEGTAGADDKEQNTGSEPS